MSRPSPPSATVLAARWWWGASTDGAQCPGRRALALVLFCFDHNSARLVLRNRSTRGAKRPFFCLVKQAPGPPPVLPVKHTDNFFLRLDAPQRAFPSRSDPRSAAPGRFSFGFFDQSRAVVRGPWAVAQAPWPVARGPRSARKSRRPPALFCRQDPRPCPWSVVRGPWSVVRGPRVARPGLNCISQLSRPGAPAYRVIRRPRFGLVSANFGAAAARGDEGKVHVFDKYSSEKRYEHVYLYS